MSDDGSGAARGEAPGAAFSLPGGAAPGREGEQDSRHVRTVFVGLMLGMLTAAVSQTIVAPAMPRIVSELGGIEHYSWIALSAMLVSTVSVPIVGKLSDLYGRKPFYVGGIVLFMLGSILSGLATGFWFLVGARVVQGLGMGTMMPLSQAIIGDLIAPRERGKYQGMMGGVFGLASVVGPLAGGYVTDHWGWRGLFFLNLPFGVLALAFIIPFMRLHHERRPHTIDYAGIATLSLGLTSGLLATVWGGTQYPWASAQIVGLYAVSVASIVAFVAAEARAAEPVLPLHLWRNSVFTFSNIANMAVAMGMFGAIFFIPVFVQGVIGNNATDSGLVLMPMMLALIVTSVANGLVISRTGRYKLLTLGGLAVLGVGFFLLTRMDARTTNGEVVRNMVIVGLGLGSAMQTFTLIVQNAVRREDLGVATAATQLFRSIGSTVGIAVLGTIMTQGMAVEIPKRLPPAAVAAAQAGGARMGAGAALDPAVMASLPAPVLAAIREGLAAALQPVFSAGLPFIALAFVATLFIRELPLRRVSHAAEAARPGAGAAAGDGDVPGESAMVEAGKEVLAELGQAGEDDAEPVLEPVLHAPARTTVSRRR